MLRLWARASACQDRVVSEQPCTVGGVRLFASQVARRESDADDAQPVETITLGPAEPNPNVDAKTFAAPGP